MESVLQDIRVALRGLRRSPGFFFTAVATLALGIGATTAIFTALSAVLLNPLPYPHPGDLYSLRTALTDGRVTTGLLSGAEVFRLNDAKSVQRASGFSGIDLTLLADGDAPRHERASLVLDGFFDVFGLPMTLGGFTKEDFVVPPPPQPNAPPQPGPQPAVIISTRLWKSLYNNDPGVIGKTIHFAEADGRIAGIAPRGFDVPHDGDIWIANPTPLNDPNHGNEGFMRLKPGSTFEHAKGELTQVIQGLATDFPAADKNRIYVPKPLVEQIVGDLKPILIIVLSATALLLLLACVNVANLLLARGAARGREMAVRAALGAGMRRLVRQMLTESFVLATLGTILGLVIGMLGLQALLVLGAAKLPRLDAVGMDGKVLLFTLVVLIITGGIIGAAPAVRLMRTDLKEMMNDGSRSASAGRRTSRWLSAMTVAEVALAIMMVASAGWLVRSFASLRNTDAGFISEKRLLFDFTFFGPKYPNPQAVIEAHADLVNAIRHIPGVASAGLMQNYPLKGNLEGSLLAQFHGEPFDANNPPGTRQRIAGPGLFTALGTKILKGRDFSDADLFSNSRVAIVNQIFVDKYLKGRDPIGVQFSAGYPAPNPNQEVTIVGVIENVRQKTLADPAEPAFYVPTTQFPIRRGTVVVASTSSNPASLENAIRNEVRKLDPRMAVEFELATDVVGGTLRRQQLGMTLMLIFGGMAIVLAAVGIYGVVSYANSLRHDEMATRLALGATPENVFGMVIRQGAVLGLIGAAIGVTLAYGSGKLVSSQVYAIRTSDPVILGVATVLIVAITIAATVLPATRASKMSPSDVLQSK
jgi:predicted permease